MGLLRFLMLLSLGVWLGGLVFFPMVAATAFSALPTAQLAGLVVRGSLLKLHWIGLVCGAVFIATSLAYERVARGRVRVFSFSNLLVVAMLALTAASQFRIIPAMEALRRSAGEINSLAASDPIRTHFESLHALSTRVEGAVLLFGLIVLYLTSRRLAASRV
jgi:Domain of unknown function (DUF4149)